MADPQGTGSNQMKVADTAATNVHGNTQIKSGDKVEYESVMCRVIEIQRNDRLLVYKRSGMQSGVKKIHAEAVTKYEPREGVIESISHRDHGASRIVSAFVVGDSDDESKTQREIALCSRMDAASGAQRPEAAVVARSNRSFGL